MGYQSEKTDDKIFFQNYIIKCTMLRYKDENNYKPICLCKKPLLKNIVKLKKK